MPVRLPVRIARLSRAIRLFPCLSRGPQSSAVGAAVFGPCKQRTAGLSNTTGAGMEGKDVTTSVEGRPSGLFRKSKERGAEEQPRAGRGPPPGTSMPAGQDSGEPASVASMAAGGHSGISSQPELSPWLNLSRCPNPSVWVKSDAQRQLLGRLQHGAHASPQDGLAVTEGAMGPKEDYSYPVLSGYAGHFDTVIVGGGIVGAATAYHLLQQGQRVCLVEARDIGGGTTGFSTAKLTSNHQLNYAILARKHGQEAAKLYGRLNEDSIADMAALVDAIPGLRAECEWERVPHITYTEKTAMVPVLRDETAKAVEAGCPARLFEGQETQAAVPDLPPSLRSSVKAAIVFDHQASFNSYSFIRGLVRHLVQSYGDRFRVFEGSLVYHVHDPDTQPDEMPGEKAGSDGKGVSFMQGAPTDAAGGPSGTKAPIPTGRPKPGFAPDGSPAVMIGTEAGGWATGRSCVVATHMPMTDRSLHWMVATPSRSFCIAVALAEDEQQGEPGRAMPTPAPGSMYISAEEPTKSFRAALWYMPRQGGQASDITADQARGMLGRPTRVLVVAGQSSPQGDTTDADAMYATTLEWTAKHWRVDRVLATWSAMDFYPADSMPYVGLVHRGSNRLFSATGFAKWGLAMGWGSGKVISDLIRTSHGLPNVAATGGPRAVGELALAVAKEGPLPDLVGLSGNDYARVFDARRWDLGKSMGGLLEEQVHVGRHFLSDWAKALTAKARPINSLRPGEGGLVRTADGETVGAYRDEQGKLTAVKPVCTHMGCHLVWLGGERTWDCPCHGSQFSYDGRVMQGPAARALHAKELGPKDLEW